MFVSFRSAAAAALPRRAARFCDTTPFAYVTEPSPPTARSAGELPALQLRPQATHGLRPGFMVLRAVRAHGEIVDFTWTFASAAAGRLLGRPALELYGKRLLDVLGGHAGCEALYEQYSRVVLHGKVGATQQVHRTRGLRDTIRHGAVRVGDGVAVTLINVSATRWAHALSLVATARAPGRPTQAAEPLRA